MSAVSKMVTVMMMSCLFVGDADAGGGRCAGSFDAWQTTAAGERLAGDLHAWDGGKRVFSQLSSVVWPMLLL